MTNEAPRYSAASFWVSQLTPAQFDQVILDVGKEGAKLMRLYRETRFKSLQLRKLPPEERLAVYTMRTPETWQIILETYPEHYRDDQRDWYELLGKLERGEMDEAKYDAALEALFMEVPV